MRGAGLDGSGGRCERRSVCSGLVFSGLRGTRGGRRTERTEAPTGVKKEPGRTLSRPAASSASAMTAGTHTVR